MPSSAVRAPFHLKLEGHNGVRLAVMVEPAPLAYRLSGSFHYSRLAYVYTNVIMIQLASSFSSVFLRTTS